MMELRLINPCEYGEAEDIWSDCFPGDGGEFCDYYFRNRTAAENVLAAFDGGHMIAALHMLPYPVAVGSHEKRLGFISGVSTLPEYRRRGVASALLREARRCLAARGCCAAVLQPFEVAFYAENDYLPMVSLDWYSLKACGIKSSSLEIPTAGRARRAYLDYVEGCDVYGIRDEEYFSRLIEEYVLLGVAASIGDAYALGYAHDDMLELDEFVGANSGESLLCALAEEYREVRFPMPAGRKAPCGRLTETQVFNMIYPFDLDGLLGGTGFSTLDEFLCSKMLAFDKY